MTNAVHSEGEWGQLGKTSHEELLKELKVLSLDWKSLEETPYVLSIMWRAAIEKGRRNFLVNAQSIVRSLEKNTRKEISFQC